MKRYKTNRSKQIRYIEALFFGDLGCQMGINRGFKHEETCRVDNAPDRLVVCPSEIKFMQITEIKPCELKMT